MGRWKVVRKWGVRVVVTGLSVAVILGGIGWSWERSQHALFLEAGFEPPGRMVSVGEQTLHVVSEGAGSPGVLLISGLGDGPGVWSKVQPRLAESTRVVSYDRPGLGWSPARQGTLTAEAAVEDVAQLLANPDLFDGPPILVGHSLGGQIARRFAYAHPSDISGLILLDPPADETPTLLKVEGLFHRVEAWLASVGLRRWQYYRAHPDLSPDQRLQQAHFRASASIKKEIVRELRGWESERFVPPEEGLGELPLTLFLANFEFPALFKDAVAEFNEAKRLIPQESEDGRLIELQSSHYVHDEHPEAVIAEVLRMLSAVDSAMAARTEAGPEGQSGRVP